MWCDTHRSENDQGKGNTPIKVAGTLRRAVRWSELTMIPDERKMECAYYFDFFRLCQMTRHYALAKGLGCNRAELAEYQSTVRLIPSATSVVGLHPKRLSDCA
jgi:hypothetical protein